MEKKDKAATPKITVALPVYNVEKYIRECLDSVVNQTFKDIEILCVNDASTDDSLNIVKAYAARDERFVIIDKAHEGLSVARNVSIEAAKGKYIYFLDCDDYIDLCTLETLYATAEENSLDVLYFDGQNFFDDELMKEKSKKLHVENFVKQCPASGVLTGLQMLAHFTQTNFKVQMCMQFYRLDFLRSEKLKCFPGLIHQDELFSTMCIVSAKRAQYIKEIFFFRRLRENSTITAMNLKLSFHSIMTVITQFIRFADTREIDADARGVLMLRTKEWTSVARRRYIELGDAIDYDELFAGDFMKHLFFNRVLVDTTRQVEELTKRAKTGEEKWAQWKATSETLESRVATLEAQINSMENSKSWRITRPLRWLASLVSKMLSFPKSK